MQVGQSSSGKASQQLLLETLPPVLVLHLERNKAADCVSMIGKVVQFTPELRVPLGTIFSYLSPHAS